MYLSMPLPMTYGSITTKVTYHSFSGHIHVSLIISIKAQAVATSAMYLNYSYLFCVSKFIISKHPSFRVHSQNQATSSLQNLLFNCKHIRETLAPPHFLVSSSSLRQKIKTLPNKTKYHIQHQICLEDNSRKQCIVILGKEQEKKKPSKIH